MLKKMVAVAGAAGLMLALSAAPAQADEKCNWGQLTSGAIADGFEQGPHASDPTGDGHGPGTVDEPRSGLGNVVEQGNLEATCQLIAGL
jgi:hypothetical protein